MEIEFEYSHGNIALLVTADITEGYPAKIGTCPEDCFPGEEPTAEITECVAKHSGEEFEYDDIHVRRRAILVAGFPVYDSVEELMQAEALEKGADQ